MSRQARALDVALAEINKHAPKRSKISDGGLGDPRHAAEKSDHNPNSKGVWRARDVTNVVGDGLDVPALALRLASMLGKIPALGSGAYLIFNRRIISTDRLSEGWRPYSGKNAHKTHLHISVATAASGYDSTQPWNIWPAKPKRPRIEAMRRIAREILADPKSSKSGKATARAVLAILK